MRVFGMKQPVPSDEDMVAAARLSALAARHRFVIVAEPAEPPAEAPRARAKPRKPRKPRSG